MLDRLVKFPSRNVTLFLRRHGTGAPVVLMHGAPGADHSTMLSLLPLSADHEVILYDHRCNGRSKGAGIETMTWENLVEDAEAIRTHLGLEKWAVVGHSFGGMVALAYAIAHSDRISRLVLLDTAADASSLWEKAPKALAERGFTKKTVAMAERFYSARINPRELKWCMVKLARAYYSNPSATFLLKEALKGLRIHASASAFIQGTKLISRWNVLNQLGQVCCPTQIVAGADDFFFPPEQQRELQKGIDRSVLRIVSGAGHNAHMEKPHEILGLVAEFLAGNDA